MPSSLRRRAIHLAIGVPAVFTSWALLVGLPLVPRPSTPGHLVARTIKLTGPQSASRTKSDRARGGWTATLPVPSGTQSVTLSWSGAPTGSARVRARSGGHWSTWTTEAGEPDEGPDRGGNGRAGIGPIWLGHDGSDEVEVQVVHGPLTDLSLDAMHWVPPAGGTDTASSEPAQPWIHRPSEWGSGGWKPTHANCTPAPVVMPSLRFAVIHHTVNSNNYSPADVPGLMASIYRYHTSSLGWCDTAYNFIIDRFGGIWQGRSGDMTKPIMGGHAKGFNTSSVGIALLGQYEPGASPSAARPSQAALDSTRNLIAWKFGIHGIDPNAIIRVKSEGSTRYRAGVVVSLHTIVGHRDVGLTACPGAYVYSQLPAMRLRVTAVLRASLAQWAPFSSATALVEQQFRDVLRRRISAADAAPWASRLIHHSWNIGQLEAALLSSSEADRKVGSVVRLYFAFFRRPPDHAGITFWLGQRDHGRSLSSIAEIFASSAEFRSRYGHLSNTSYIDRVYRNVLGRAPDRPGLRFWSTQLATGVGRGQLMANLSESTEYRVKSGRGVIVAETFEALLRRAVDRTAYVYYVRRLASGATVASIAATLFASDEYQHRF